MPKAAWTPSLISAANAMSSAVVPPPWCTTASACAVDSAIAPRRRPLAKPAASMSQPAASLIRRWGALQLGAANFGVPGYRIDSLEFAIGVECRGCGNRSREQTWSGIYGWFDFIAAPCSDDFKVRKEYCIAYEWNSQVVQRREGLRLSHARRWREGCLLPFQCDSGRRFQVSDRRTEGGVRRRSGSKGSGGRERVAALASNNLIRFGSPADFCPRGFFIFAPLAMNRDEGP